MAQKGRTKDETEVRKNTQAKTWLRAHKHGQPFSATQPAKEAESTTKAGTAVNWCALAP